MIRDIPDLLCIIFHLCVVSKNMRYDDGAPSKALTTTLNLIPEKEHELQANRTEYY